MDERVRDYARHRLNHAREELATAQESIANHRFRAAISRSYYAIFYMASAALLTQSVKRGKHSAVQSAVFEFLVKPGHIEPEFGRLFRHARDLREEADYADDTDIDEMTARQTLSDAERFVERLERFLHDVGALP